MAQIHGGLRQVTTDPAPKEWLYHSQHYRGVIHVFQCRRSPFFNYPLIFSLKELHVWYLGKPVDLAVGPRPPTNSDKFENEKLPRE